MRAMTLLSAVGSALLLAAQPALSQENAAEKAVEAAKQYSGVTLNTAEEAGLLAMLGININGPEWEELTGISVQVNEIPFEELFTKQMLEHRAGSGAYDVMLVGPSWVADMARGGALEPLDAYIEEYGVAEEFDDIAPAFKDWMTYDGKT
ncbi:MAG: extracellular solute-binding protein, partial [Roseibium sp.]